MGLSGKNLATTTKTSKVATFYSSERSNSTSDRPALIWPAIGALEAPPGLRDIPAKFLGHPRFLPTKPKHPFASLDGQNRQSPIASVQRTQPTLAGHSAIPRGTNTTPMNANRAIRIAAQRTQGLWGPNPVFWGGHMSSTLAIRITAITLASDSAITITRFRPSKFASKTPTPPGGLRTQGGQSLCSFFWPDSHQGNF